MYRMRELRLDSKSAWLGAATLVGLALIANIRMLMDAQVPMAEYLPRMAIQSLAVWMLVPFVFLMPRWLNRRKHGEAFRVIFVYCAAVAGSALNLWISNMLTAAAGLGVLTEPRSELIAVFVVGPVWVVLLGRVLESWIKYTSAQHSLIGEALRAEYVRMHETGTIELLHAKVGDWVSANLGEKTESMLARLRQLDTNSPDSVLQKFADDLRGTAQDDVRPLSRELWSDANQTVLPRPPAGFLWNVVSTQLFAPRLVALIYFAGLLSDAAGSSEFSRELGAAAFEAGLVWLLLGSANLAMTRLPRLHAQIYLGFWGFIQLSNVLSLATVNPGLQPYEVAIRALFDTILSSVLLIGTSAIWLVQGLLTDQLHQMRQTMDAEWVKRVATMQQVAGISREFATHLHGQVQSGLLAGATALEQAVARQDPIAAQAAMSEVQQLLEELSILPSRRQRTLPALIKATCDKWAAVCQIQLDMDHRLLDSDSAGGQMAAKVIEEAVTNSFRHGQAENVRVQVRATGPAQLGIEVTDDGIGFSRARPGLGHSFIEFASNGDWGIARLDDRTVLSARVQVGRLELSPA